MTTRDARIPQGTPRSLVPPETSPFEAVPGPKTAVGSLARGAEKVRSAHAHATGGPRATRRAGSSRQGGGNLPRCAAAPRSPSRPQPRSASRRCALGNGVRAATFSREVPPTGRRRRAPVGRGKRLDSLRQPSAPHRSSRAARRSRITSATRRLPPHRAARPLSTGHASGTISFWALRARGAVPRPAFRCGPTRGTRRRPATSAASQRAADGRARRPKPSESTLTTVKLIFAGQNGLCGTKRALVLAPA